MTVLLTIIQCLAAVVAYFLVVKQRGTFLEYVVGYGLLIPFGFWFAPIMIEYLDIHHFDLKIVTSMLTTVVVCRTLEGIHGTSPDGVEDSLQNYAIYFSTMVHHEFDPKRRRIVGVTMKEVARQVLRCAILFHILSLLMSILVAHDYQVFPSPVELDSFAPSWDLLHPGHWGNCYLLGSLFLLMTSFALNAAAFGENIKGFATPPVFANPLLDSESPSDFWGRKWNLTIHRNLKGGFYRPLRKIGASVLLASGVTFAMSGILHDFYTRLMFYQHERHARPDDPEPNIRGLDHGHWKMLAFFSYNWILIMLERPVAMLLPASTIIQKLPKFIRSTMILFICLPVSHWFTSQWALGGYFEAKQLGYWKIAKIST
jgi:hypothetical protein